MEHKVTNAPEEEVPTIENKNKEFAHAVSPPPAYANPYYANNQPPTSPYGPPTVRAEKGRRVGTFSMALCLIAFGAVLLLRAFIPSIDYVLIARMSPVILVFLGIEILISNSVNKDSKLRYDGVSMFVCIILIFGSLLGAILPEIYYREQRRGAANEALVSSLDDYGYGVFKNTDLVSTINWYVSISDGKSIGEDQYNLSMDDITLQDYIQARVYLAGSFTSKEEFARASEEVIKKLNEISPKLDYISFYSADEENRTENIKMFLALDGRHEINWVAEEMLQDIDLDYRTVNGSYIPEYEVELMLEYPENYDASSYPVLWEELKKEHENKKGQGKPEYSSASEVPAESQYSESLEPVAGMGLAG